MDMYDIPREKGDSSHMFRHMFGAMMLRRGFTIEAVSRMMGHASIEETQRTYGTVDSEKIHADYSKIKKIEGIIHQNQLTA